MKGKHKVVVQNNKLHYELTIKRNITIIQGDSATGKTTLIEMLRQNMNLGEASGIDVVCDVPCRILEGQDWQAILTFVHGNIIFIDEGNRFIQTEAFAKAVKESDNYFVLITRENLYNLPYSVEEIYGLHSSGKYQNTRRIYQELYHIYSELNDLPVHPNTIIVEDSNSGYDFYKNICEGTNIDCISACGKSNIFKKLKNVNNDMICVIADGAAIGPEMSNLYKQMKVRNNVHLYLPESFEWLILKSGIIKDHELDVVLAAPEDFVNSQEYFSWERFFTKLLIQKTDGSYLQYQKSSLNKAYLHEKNKQLILKEIQGIEF